MIAAILQVVAPLVLQIVAAWQQRTGQTRLPTIEELRLDYNAHRAEYIAEGEAWQAAHPRPVPPAA